MFHATETPKKFLEIVFAHPAYRKIRAYTDLCNNEISALGSVRVDGNRIIVEDLHLFAQTVSGTSTVLAPGDISKFICEYIKMGKDPSVLKFWWHSHVNMGTFWSGTDLNTIDGFSAEWLLSMVCNKAGEAKLRFDMFTPFRVCIDDMPFTVEYDTTYNGEYRREIKEKVNDRFSFSDLFSQSRGGVVYDERNPMGAPIPIPGGPVDDGPRHVYRDVLPDPPVAPKKCTAASDPSVAKESKKCTVVLPDPPTDQTEFKDEHEFVKLHEKICPGKLRNEGTWFGSGRHISCMLCESFFHNGKGHLEGVKTTGEQIVEELKAKRCEYEGKCEHKQRHFKKGFEDTIICGRSDGGNCSYMVDVPSTGLILPDQPIKRRPFEWLYRAVFGEKLPNLNEPNRK